MSDDRSHAAPASEGNSPGAGGTEALNEEHAAAPSNEAESRPDSSTPAESVHIPAALDELLDIWRDVLGFQEIDREATFLAHGGQSLTAMQVVNRVRARFGVRLPLPLLLGGSTADEIAAHIDSETAKKEVSRP